MGSTKALQRNPVAFFLTALTLRQALASLLIGFARVPRRLEAFGTRS